MKQSELKQIIKEEFEQALSNSDITLDQLQQEFSDTLIIPSMYGGFKMYPNLSPSGNPTNTSQFINFEIKNGELHLNAIYGYGKSLQLIGPINGIYAKSVNIAGMAMLDLGYKGYKKISIPELKTIVNKMKMGLEKESESQKTFYQTHTPD